MSVEGVALERLGDAGGEIAAGAIVMRRALYKLQRRVDVMEGWLRDVEGAGWSLKMEVEIDISSVQSISTTKPCSYHPGTPAHFPSKPVPLQSMASTYVRIVERHQRILCRAHVRDNPLVSYPKRATCCGDFVANFECSNYEVFHPGREDSQALCQGLQWSAVLSSAHRV